MLENKSEHSIDSVGVALHHKKSTLRKIHKVILYFLLNWMLELIVQHSYALPKSLTS